MLQITKQPNWKIEEVEPNSHRLIFNGVKSGWTGSILLMSDEHWDNRHSNHALIRKHHEEALRLGAPIFKFGDTFCLMQGKWDKRADQRQLRPEHREGEDSQQEAGYFDLVAETASQFYAPYAQNLALITMGNHEQSVLERHHVNILGNFSDRLRAKTGTAPLRGCYSGFVTVGYGRPSQGTLLNFGFNLFYHHGYGGGGEVTRGMIDNNRTRGQAMADIFYSGHIHRRNMDENHIITCNERSSVQLKKQTFLRGASYKDEYDKGKGGWHIRNGRAGRPLGGWWLDLHYINHQLIYSARPAE